MAVGTLPATIGRNHTTSRRANDRQSVARSTAARAISRYATPGRIRRPPITWSAKKNSSPLNTELKRCSCTSDVLACSNGCNVANDEAGDKATVAALTQYRSRANGYVGNDSGHGGSAP